MKRILQKILAFICREYGIPFAALFRFHSKRVEFITSFAPEDSLRGFEEFLNNLRHTKPEQLRRNSFQFGKTEFFAAEVAATTGFKLFLPKNSLGNLDADKLNNSILFLLETAAELCKNEDLTSFEQRLKETTRHLDSIIFSSNPDGSRYYFITDAVEKIIGITAEEIILNPYKMLKRIIGKDFKRFKDFRKEILSGNNVSIEYKLLNFGDEELVLRHSGFPIIEDGKVVRIDGIIHDITQERKNMQLLQKSEERFRTLFETLEDLIFILDDKGRFTSVNANGALAFEYIPQELVGKHFLDFVNDDDKPMVAKSFQNILKNNSGESFEVEFVSKYGKDIVFEVNIHATYEHNKLESIIGIGRNITSQAQDKEKMRELNNKLIEANRLISIERDRAKQKISVLEELNKMKNEFVSNISHELRTPLASIIGFSETIESDPNMPPAMKKEFNQIILTEAKRLSKLINDVLDISKIEAGQMALDKNEFNIINVIRSVIEKIEPMGEAKNISFSYNIPDDEYLMFADKERIFQVYENILLNAVKFTQEGGRITMLAQSIEKEFEVIISDTGAGIPKKDLPFIFNKFFRVSRPGEEIPGTGLGLALVKQIIDLHRGLITVQSEENQGTTVVLKLPLIKHKVKV